MAHIGIPELVCIVVVVILLFGAKKIPQLAKGVGEGLRLFRKEIKDTDGDSAK